MARTKQAARKTHCKRPMPITLESNLKTDDLENHATTSKIVLGGFTSKSDRKRKREASPVDVNPLSLRNFASPMASRIKKEETVSDKEESLLANILAIQQETKPPVKRLKVESGAETVGESARSEPLVALEKALDVNVGVSTATNASWFQSYPQSEDDGPEQYEPVTPAIPQTATVDRATATPLNTWFADAIAGMEPTESPEVTEEQKVQRRQRLPDKALAKKERKAARLKEWNEAYQIQRQNGVTKSEIRAADKAKKAERKKSNQAIEAAALVKKQEKAERHKEVKAAAKAKKQQTKELRKAAEAEALIEKQKKEQLERQDKVAEAGTKAEEQAQQQAKDLEAAKALKQAKPDDASQQLKADPEGDQTMSKAERSIAAEKKSMSSWKSKTIERHVLKTIRHHAVKTFKVTNNLELVLKGLKEAQKAVQGEQKAMVKAAKAANKQGPVQGKGKGKGKGNELPN